MSWNNPEFRSWCSLLIITFIKIKSRLFEGNKLLVFYFQVTYSSIFKISKFHCFCLQLNHSVTFLLLLPEWGAVKDCWFKKNVNCLPGIKHHESHFSRYSFQFVHTFLLFLPFTYSCQCYNAAVFLADLHLFTKHFTLFLYKTPRLPFHKRSCNELWRQRQCTWHPRECTIHCLQNNNASGQRGFMCCSGAELLKLSWGAVSRNIPRGRIQTSIDLGTITVALSYLSTDISKHDQIYKHNTFF